MKLLPFICKVSRPAKWYLIGMFIAVVFIALNNTLKPCLIKLIIDDVGQSNYIDIWPIVLFFAFLQFFLIACWAVVDYCHYKYTPILRDNIANNLLERVSDYSYKFFQENFSGSISSKVNDAVKYTPEVIFTFAIQFFQPCIIILCSVVVLATVHYLFAVVVIIWIGLFSLITYYYMQYVKFLSKSTAEASATIWGGVIDYFTNILMVKVFARRKYEKDRLRFFIDDYLAKNLTLAKYLRNFYLVQGIICSIYLIGCLCAMIYLSKLSLVSPGDFALVFMLNFQIVDWLFHLSDTLHSFVPDIGSISQALALFESEPEIKDLPSAKILSVKQAQISFNNVEFNYPGAEPLFKNKNVIIKAGSKVGLVGYSGSGKSTFINLILRLFDVTSGSIKINDQDIREVTQDSLHLNIGLIPQDPTLFHRTLSENICYGKIDATPEEIILAAKQANADEFISKLPQEYSTPVGERGIKLSGGQRQRIIIARVALKNAPILILDEATSQLDSITEHLIQESLMRLMHGKTSIVIAHRLSTLLNMDRILVFDHGKIVEDGTHAELLSKNGLYKSLWDKQVGGFIGDDSLAESS